MKSITVTLGVLIILSGIILSNISPFFNAVRDFLLSTLGRVLIVIGMFILFARID